MFSSHDPEDKPALLALLSLAQQKKSSLAIMLS